MKKRDFNSLITLTRTGKYDYEMMRQIIRAGNTVETIDYSITQNQVNKNEKV